MKMAMQVRGRMQCSKKLSKRCELFVDGAEQAHDSVAAIEGMPKVSGRPVKHAHSVPSAPATMQVDVNPNMRPMRGRVTVMPERPTAYEPSDNDSLTSLLARTAATQVNKRVFFMTTSSNHGIFPTGIF